MPEESVICKEEMDLIRSAFSSAMEASKNESSRRERYELANYHDDVPPFMEFPLARKPKEIEGADAVILGIPFDGLTAQSPLVSVPPTISRPGPGSVYWRMGSDKGPDNIRRYSLYYSINHNRGFFPEIDRNLLISDHIRVVDYGDVPYTPADVEGNLERAEERVAEIVKAGSMPIVIGGDHTVPTPTLRALLKPRKKKVGLIVFDSHVDLSYEPKNFAASQWSQVLELGRISPKNFVLIGIRGVRNSIFEKNVLEALDLRVITIDEVKERGIRDVMDEAVAIASEGTDGMYSSLDIDVMDPSQVIAQKAPEFWGMTIDEIFHAIRRVSREKLIGFDINEYSPDYDFNGMGAQFCARIVAEVLGGLALRRWDGKA